MYSVPFRSVPCIRRTSKLDTTQPATRQVNWSTERNRTKPELKSSSLLCLLFVGAIHLLSICPTADGSHYTRFQMSDYCDPRNLHQLMLSPHANTTTIMIKLKRELYKPGMNCTLVVRAPPNYGLAAFITKIKLRRYLKRADKLEILTENSTLFRMYGHNQDELPEKTILSKSSLYFHFTSETFPAKLIGKGFKIVVSLYTTAIHDGQECDTNLGLNFNCRNGFCIDNNLECDGTDNCRNQMDEMECDETSETKLSLYVFMCTIVVMVSLVVMFMMKNKDKRKEIVRRMSRVYANNPILCVMENSGVPGVANPPILLPNHHRHQQRHHFIQPPPPPSPQSPPPLQAINPTFDYSAMESPKRLTSSKSKLSLSLPQGIDQIHNSNNNNNMSFNYTENHHNHQHQYQYQLQSKHTNI